MQVQEPLALLLSPSGCLADVLAQYGHGRKTLQQFRDEAHQAIEKLYEQSRAIVRAR